MSWLCDRAACCGCGNCEIVCPKRCITMQEDAAGFRIPVLDAARCVNCGACREACPVLHHKNAEELSHSAYAAYARSKELRFAASSGGMFAVLAGKTLEQYGAVYGAAFDADLQLRCTAAQSEEELVPLFKSKYLQSDLGQCFPEIRQRLENGQRVLFVATPCQVFALQRYLHKEYENLTTVDFLCHGVPSQRFFDRCKSYVEEKQGIRILDYQFRAKKKNGSTPHYFRMKYEKNGKIRTKTKLYICSPFYLAFQKYISLRDSCYDCRFLHSNRCSDLTIGDFHEIDKYLDGINRFDGVSTVVVHTTKGAALWKSVQPDVVCHEVEFARLYANGELMCGATQRPKRQPEFYRDLATCPVHELERKYFPLRKELPKILYYSLPKCLRKMMKKVVR